MSNAREISPWWAGKMIFALGLLSWFVASGVYGLWRGGAPFWFGRVLIFAGALISLYHFYRIKRAAGSLCCPETLVTTGGLLPRIRHPMYLGELLVIIGFVVTIATPIAVIPAAFYLWFISMLCQDEDLNNAEQFPSEYEAWRTRSKRLLPGVW